MPGRYVPPDHQCKADATRTRPEHSGLRQHVGESGLTVPVTQEPFDVSHDCDSTGADVSTTSHMRARPQRLFIMRFATPRLFVFVFNSQFFGADVASLIRQCCWRDASNRRLSRRATA
jgi:hypothetical protein